MYITPIESTEMYRIEVCYADAVRELEANYNKLRNTLRSIDGAYNIKWIHEQVKKALEDI